uniref:Uncharacterized protein n=1 Tax=Ditylenchus dipsaci TaxID=166011 RepID=A0A915DAY4_9BILA
MSMLEHEIVPDKRNLRGRNQSLLWIFFSNRPVSSCQSCSEWKIVKQLNSLEEKDVGEEGSPPSQRIHCAEES